MFFKICLLGLIAVATAHTLVPRQRSVSLEARVSPLSLLPVSTADARLIKYNPQGRWIDYDYGTPIATPGLGIYNPITTGYYDYPYGGYGGVGYNDYNGYYGGAYNRVPMYY